MGVSFRSNSCVEMTLLPSIRYRVLGEENKHSEWTGLNDSCGEGIGNERLSGFEITCDRDGFIEGQCRMDNGKWTPITKNGEVFGDSMHTHFMCAIRLRIPNTHGYYIYYRVRMENGEWSSWTGDFNIAGDIHGSTTITGVHIRVFVQEPRISYRALMEKGTWTLFVKEGDAAGAEGKGTRMEGLVVLYEGPGCLTVQGHAENKGWMEKVGSGELCGTRDEGLRLEAIRIWLEGAESFHISYCVCIKGSGWQGWVRDGEMAGTEGKSLPIEAIRIQLRSDLV